MGFISMKNLISWLCCLIGASFFLAVGPAVVQAREVAFSELLSMWRTQKYQEVLPLLVKYREGPYGRNIQVDYMIATSCCRLNDFVDIGHRYFNRILSSYELGDADVEMILRERDFCSKTHDPALMAFLRGRPPSGSDVGVRGKTFYWLDRQNAPLGTDLIQVVQDIPAETFKARLFPRSGARDAVIKIRSVAGSGFTIQAFSHFVIATASGQTPSEIAAIGRHLEQVMAFFNSEYQMPLPEYLVTVYIVPGVWDLQKLAGQIHGLKLSDGSIGYSHRDDLSICAVSSGIHAGTLKHELFHLMVRHDFGDIPPWLDEGLASLYEVSRIAGTRVTGLRNWREDVLKRFWDQRPGIGTMVGMPWNVFNAKDYELSRQAVNHATARYFIQYLQEEQQLAAVYKAFQEQPLDTVTQPPGENAVQLLEHTLQKPVNQIDTDFASWFNSLGKKATSTDIRVLQNRLNALGYDAGPADGMFGPRTRTALKTFQTDHQLSPTGRLDDHTLGMLNSKL